MSDTDQEYALWRSKALYTAEKTSPVIRKAKELPLTGRAGWTRWYEEVGKENENYRITVQLCTIWI